MSYRVHMGMTLAFIVERQRDRVLGCVERVRRFMNQVQVFRVNEIAALANLSRLDRARTLAGQLLALNPGFTVSRFRENRRRVRAITPGGYEPLYEGLLAAGLLE